MINKREITGVNKNNKFRDETDFWKISGFDHALVLLASPSDVIFAYLACPLSDIIFYLQL